MEPASGASFVGRDRECSLLDAALNQAKRGQGGTWVLAGAAGMGKTRLLRWVEQRARSEGFEVHWGYCLKEANNAFFPFVQIFRPGEAQHSTSAAVGEEGAGPTVLLFEEDRPTRLVESLVGLPAKHPSLLVSRERETTVRQRYPGLSRSTMTLWLTRAEGPGAINPTSLDSLAESIGRYYESFPGAVVGVTGLEYLISQNQFLPVLKLIQYLRDAAEGGGGRLLISFNPVTLEAREVALLEGEGEIAWSAKTREAEKPVTTEAPAMLMLQYLRTLEGWSKSGPQIILLDDLQWSDPPSLQAFQFLARNLRSLPVLLLATLLEGEGSGSSDAGEAPLEEILDAMRREGTLTSLPINRLEGSALAELATSVLGALPRMGHEDGSLAPIFDRAGGSPYFLMEILRQLQEDGYLSVKDGRAGLTVPGDSGKVLTSRLPDTLKRLIVRRLRSLNAEELSLLRTAAVAGTEFEAAMIADTVHLPLAEVTQTLDGIGRRYGLVERHGKVLGRWSFSHPLIWEGIHAETPPETVRALASTLAAWSAKHHPEDIDNVARLYYHALDLVDGPAWVQRALEKAIAEHSSETTERYHHWFQELLRAGGIPVEERVRTGLEVALQLYSTQGRSRPVDRMLDSLLAVEASPTLRATLGAYRAYLVSVENGPEARRMFRKARDDLPSGPEAIPPIVRALELALEGNARYSEGNLQGAMEAYRAGSVVEGPGVPAWLTNRLQYDAAWVACEVDNSEVYEEMHAKGLALATKLRQERFRAYFLSVEAVSLINAGELHRAEQVETAYRDILRRVGNVSGAAIAAWDLASLLITMGNYPRARQVCEEGKSLARTFGMKLEEDLFLIPEARIELGEGRPREAVDRLEHLIQTVPANSATGPVASFRVLLAHALVRTGHTDRAAEVLAQIQDVGKELKPHEVPSYHRGLSDIARVRGTKEEAWNQADLALTLARKLQDRVEEAHSLECMAEWELRFGSPSTAKLIRAEAGEIFAATGAVSLVSPASNAHLEM